MGGIFGGGGFRSATPVDYGEYSASNPYGRAPAGYGYIRVIDPSVPRGYRNVGLVLGASRTVSAESKNATWAAPEAGERKVATVSTMPVKVNPNDIYKNNPTPTSTPGAGTTTSGPRGETAGYVAPIKWNEATNPYAAQQTQDSAAGAKSQQYAAQNIQQLQAQSDKAAGGYPAMANDYGLGATPGSGSAPTYAGQPTTQPAGDSGSRGFNPWSLTGEATARGN